ncbi:2-dehydro-3-deoxygalactonokinase [Pinisolibacter sp.]|uniref:2-dehydro-3-deoxygalactonokinase n=1 Tax=Pinisolibacter sp. TaxID=2172024 RepID=UPI002FDDFD5B
MNSRGTSASGTQQPVCVAVDWGTTRFRAHLVGEDGVLLDSVASDDGMSHVDKAAFEGVLTRLCAPWLSAHPGLPVVMAGMVGSRNGWREVPYVTCPAGVSEIAAGLMSFEIAGGTRVHIVPGLVTDDAAADVMRGEETQILGAGVDDAVVVLPGTHSKWATVRHGRIETFRTFMTGEIFALLTRQSVLRLLGEPPHDEAAARAAFAIGLTAASADGGILNRAFHARTGVLAGRMAPQDVEPYVSGLLIGAEVGEAKRLVPADLPIVLVAGGVVAVNYRFAIETTGSRVTLVDPERSFVDGLLRIARHSREAADVHAR